MKTARGIAAACLVLAALGLLLSCLPGGPLDLADVAGACRRYDTAQRRDADLVRRGAAVRQRRQAREATTQALLAGELGVLEAAARFRAANRADPPPFDRLAGCFPG